MSVSVIGDAIVEAANESFGLSLSSPSGGAILARTKALGIILDDDSTRTISMSPLTVSVMEPLSGTVNATFTVTLSADAGQTTTVNYATASGTALAGSDYTATTGTLSFEPGDRTKTIAVPVLSDSLVESPETFTLTLSGPTNGTIGAGAGTATATITDSLSQIPMAFFTITPCRIVDTRSPAPGSPLAAGWRVPSRSWGELPDPADGPRHLVQRHRHRLDIGRQREAVPGRDGGAHDVEHQLRGRADAREQRDRGPGHQRGRRRSPRPGGRDRRTSSST